MWELLLMQGKHTETLLDRETAQRSEQGYLLALGRLALTYLRAGRNKDARRILRQLLEFQAHGWEGCLQIALIQHSLGNDEEARKWLERAAGNRISERIKPSGSSPFGFAQPIVSATRPAI
jgi:hypothetical protein